MGCCPMKIKNAITSTQDQKDTNSPMMQNNINSNILQVQNPNMPVLTNVIKFYTKKPNENDGKDKKLNIISVVNYETLLKKDIDSNKGKANDCQAINTKDETTTLFTHIELSPDDITLIKDSFKTHFLFKYLSIVTINKIIGHLSLFQLSEGDNLFSEGERGHFFFIVKSGNIELALPKVNEKKYFKKGDTFGEMALLHSTHRSGTVRCVENSEVFFLEGNFFREIVHKINKADYMEKMSFLKIIPIFAGLEPIQIENVSRCLVKCEFSKGFEIIKEGEKGESLYIIKEGVVTCSKSGREMGKMFSKDHFGESSILFETKRAFSITSFSVSICYQLPKSALVEILGENYKNVLLMGLMKEGFRKSKFLKYLLISDIFQKMFPVFKLNFYTNAQVVFNADNAAMNKKIIIVIEGHLLKSQTREKVALRGEIYGEGFISNSNEVFESEIVAMSQCITLEAYWKDMISTLDIQINNEKKVLGFFVRWSHLRKIQIFKHLSDKRLMDISNFMAKMKYQPGEVIIEEGSEGNFLYFLYKGKVKVFKNKKFLREYQDYTCFGEISILLNGVHTATVIAESKVSTYTLSKDCLKSCLDRQMIDFLSHKISLMDNFSTDLDKMYYIKTLGEGNFSQVSLVHNQKSLYAIKAINKKVAEQNAMLIKYFLKEKNILLTLDHPFVIKLVKTLKNDNYIFYLMEYVNGITLGKVLENRGETFWRNKAEAQFYIASLIIIVDYLSSKAIAHRDLKPDNIMLDEKGYVKLIDFNTSITIKDLTTTIVGTPHYTAPEILLGKGYGLSVDYWSIGVIAFEIYFGFRPFGTNSTDPMEIYSEVMSKSIDIPGGVNDESAILLIQKLLKRQIHQRLCSMPAFQNEDFFANFDWDAIVDFKAIAPNLPQVDLNTEVLLKNTKVKYADKIKKPFQMNYDAISVSSEDEEKGICDPNWSDEF